MKDLKITTYSSFIIKNRLTGLYWINKRINPNKSMYRYYQSGGGHIEENEIPIDAVQREFNEETGIYECTSNAFELQRIDIQYMILKDNPI